MGRPKKINAINVRPLQTKGWQKISLQHCGVYNEKTKRLHISRYTTNNFKSTSGKPHCEEWANKHDMKKLQSKARQTTSVRGWEIHKCNNNDEQLLLPAYNALTHGPSVLWRIQVSKKNRALLSNILQSSDKAFKQLFIPKICPTVIILESSKNIARL